MKIIYETTVTDKVCEAIAKAKREGRRVEKVELSAAEWRQFCEENKYDLISATNWGKQPFLVSGVPVFCEPLPAPGAIIPRDFLGNKI